MTAWTEQTLGALVVAMRPAPEYVTIAHVGNATGWDRRRTVDLVAIAVWPSRGLSIEAFEIKTSRADWRREKKNPEKAEAVAQHVDAFSIVAPAGVVPLEELPTDWGLYEAPKEPGAKPRLTCVRDPLTRMPTAEVARTFLAALLQRLTRDVVPREDVARQAQAMADARCKTWFDGKDPKESPDLEAVRRKLEQYESAFANFAAATGLPIERLHAVAWRSHAPPVRNSSPATKVVRS